VDNEFSFEIQVTDESAAGTVTCEALVGENALGQGRGASSVACRGKVSQEGNSLSSSFSSIADPLAREHVETGTDYLDQDQTDEAIAEFEEAIRLAPELAEAHAKLGFAYYMKGQFDKAITELQTALEFDPDDAHAQRNLGTVYGEQGKWEDAIAAYETAIELDPDFGEAYGDMVWPYIEVGNLSEAVAAGEEAIELVPDYVMAHINLGTAYAEMDRPEDAIAEFQEAIRLDPEEPLAHTNLGLSYMSQDQFAEAIAEYEEAIRLDPEDAEGYNHLAVAFYRQGDYDEAIAQWQKTLQVEPQHANAHKNLGVVYAAQGQVEEAITELETYLQLQPDAGDRAAVEGKIAELKEETVTSANELRNAAGGYSLRYPEGWYHNEDGSETSLAPTQEDYEASSLNSPLITLITWPLAQATENFNLTADAAPIEFLGAMAERLEAEILGTDSFNLAGYPAAVAATTGTLQGNAYEGNLIVALVEERFFLVEGLSPPDQWDDFRPTFVDIINSLTFFEPEE
jgi:superkiller protein 3